MRPMAILQMHGLASTTTPYLPLHLRLLKQPQPPSTNPLAEIKANPPNSPKPTTKNHSHTMSPTTSTLALLARRTTTTTLRPLRPSQLRSFTSARSPLLAAKDTMDKDSINTRSTEYSKTGGDDAAAHESGAFDPSETRPEAEEASGASGKKVSSSLLRFFTFFGGGHLVLRDGTCLKPLLFGPLSLLSFHHNSPTLFFVQGNEGEANCFVFLFNLSLRCRTASRRTRSTYPPRTRRSARRPPEATSPAAARRAVAARRRVKGSARLAGWGARRRKAMRGGSCKGCDFVFVFFSKVGVFFCSFSVCVQARRECGM